MPLLVALSDVFGPILKRHLPEVAPHLENECVAPIMYLTEWIMTLFLASFQFAVAVRVFDSFLVEGELSLVVGVYRYIYICEPSSPH